MVRSEVYSGDCGDVSPLMRPYQPETHIADRVGCQIVTISTQTPGHRALVVTRPHSGYITLNTSPRESRWFLSILATLRHANPRSEKVQHTIYQSGETPKQSALIAFSSPLMKTTKKGS